MPFAVGQARPLRWLFAAPFSASPQGRVLGAAGERFQTLMSKLGPAATAEIPDDLGDSTHRKLALKFARPRDFRAAEVIKQVEFLATLSSIAEDLKRKGSLQGALAKLKSTVGDGPLVRAAQQLVDTPPKIETTPKNDGAPSTAEPTAPKAGKQGGSAIDAIFAQADIAPTPTAADTSSAAKSGLDAFIGAMRSSGTGSERSSSSTATKTQAQELAELLQRAVEAAVLDLMATPVIASLEITWRGFRTVVSAAPGADGLAIDMLDTDDAALVEHLTRRLDVPPMDRPDAVFVPFPIGSTETLAALASLGERHSTPIVTEVPDEATGAKLQTDADPASVAAPDSWTELRSSTATRWLCACKNAMVLANEEVGITRRIVLGSPVWGVAAMLSASVGQTGGPGQIFGRAGALVGPASYGLEPGDETIATEDVATIDHQRMLADHGVLVLGSERGSDRLRLAAAPMVHARQDDPQLPGQILVGRAARFTRAIRDDLPPHATEQEVAARLTEAATNFLPRSPRGAIALNVQTDEEGKLGVETSIGAALAGSSFKFSSDL